MFNRKRVIKKDKDGNIIKGVFIQEKYADRIGFYMIKKTLPSLSNEKLFQTKAIAEQSPDTNSYKPQITELLKKEFEKRGIEYL
jgi:hypothetical protein